MATSEEKLDTTPRPARSKPELRSAGAATWVAGLLCLVLACPACWGGRDFEVCAR